MRQSTSRLGTALQMVVILIQWFVSLLMNSMAFLASLELMLYMMEQLEAFRVGLT